MYSHPHTLTVRCQPAVKSTVSQQRLGGEEGAAQHPSLPWGSREGLGAEPPASPREAVPCLPPEPPFPCPVSFASPGGSFGSQMWSSSSWGGGWEQREERESDLWNQRAAETGVWAPPLP